MAYLNAKHRARRSVGKISLYMYWCGCVFVCAFVWPPKAMAARKLMGYEGTIPRLGGFPQAAKNSCSKGFDHQKRK